MVESATDPPASPRSRLTRKIGAPDTSMAFAKRIVVLGDTHYYHLAVAPWRLAGKRLLGQANLYLNRRRHFDKSLLAEVVAHAVSVEPDLLVLTGDLTTTALAGEFDDVLEILAPLTSDTETIVVPGNHDRYTFMSSLTSTFERRLGSLSTPCFPHWRAITDRWSVIALDSAVPRFVTSRGLVDQPQLEIAKGLVRPLDDRSGLIIVCHYPFIVPPGIHWRSSHRLAKATALGEMVRQVADSTAQCLYLHGHIHQPWWWQPSHDGLRNLTMINAGSPSRKDSQYPVGQGFWQIDLPEQPSDPFALIHHVPATSNGGWVWAADQVC